MPAAADKSKYLPEARSEAALLPLGAIKRVSGANFTPQYPTVLWDESSTAKARVKSKTWLKTN